MSETNPPLLEPMQIAAEARLAAKAAGDPPLALYAEQLELALRDVGGDHDRAREILASHIQQAERWSTILAGLRSRTERRREAPERLDPAWLSRRHEKLRRTILRDARAAFGELAALVAGAVVGGRAADLEPVVVPLEWPDPWRRYAGTLAAGLRALREAAFSAAVPMLELLLGAAVRPSVPIALEPSIEAGLRVFAARISLAQHDDLFLSRPDDPILASAYLDRAQKLAPGDPRVWAALGDIHRKRKHIGDALACYQEAITLDPKCPDGHVCMGRYHEDEARWEEADGWYRTAVDLVRNSDDPLRALTGLHLPCSRRLLARLATVLAESAPATALKAAAAAAKLPIKGPSTGLGLVHGRLLEQAGRTSAAVDAYFSAARGTPADRRYALEMFARAAGLAPGRPDIAWRYADALLVQSALDRPPWTDRVLVERSLEEWTRAFISGPPDRDHGWAYITRAAIEGQRARFGGTDRVRALWATIAWAEQALLRHPDRVTTWCLLSRTFRMLGVRRAALHASRRAVELDPESTSAREERLIMSITLLEWSEARQMLEAMEQQPGISGPWLLAVRSGLRLYDQSVELGARLGPAIELMDQALATGPSGAADYRWLQVNRARAAMLAGDRDRGRSIYQAVWDARDLDWADDREEYLWAGLMVGATEELISHLTQLLDGGTVSPPIALRLRGLAKLKAGMIEAGEQDLRAALADPHATPEDLNDFRFVLIPDELLADLPSWARPDEARPVLETIFAEIRARGAEIPAPSIPEEIERIARPWESAGEPIATAARVGSTLARARFAAGLEQCRLYRELLGHPDTPEARLGLDHALAACEEAADALVRAEKLEDAERGYGALEAQLADLAEPAGQGDRRDAVRIKQAILALLQHHGVDAYQRFKVVVTSMSRTAEATAVGAKVARCCATLTSDPTAMWYADVLWSALESLATDETARSAFHACRDAWLAELGERWGANPSHAASHGFYTIATPLAVELGRGLTSEELGESALLDEWREIATRITLDTGVELPQLRLRNSPEIGALDARYILMIEEVPLAAGRVEPTGRYVDLSREVLIGLGLSAADLVAAEPPFEHGCWVLGPALPELEARGISPWSSAMYIAAHIERVVRDEIARFVGIDEVDALLRRWSSDDDCAPCLAQLLGRAGAKIELTRILRELAKDHLPLVHGREILAALADGSANPLALWPAVGRIRRRMRARIVELTAKLHQLLLPAHLEQMLSLGVDAEEQFLALPPVHAQEILSGIRALLQDRDPARCVLVVGDPALRPFVRRLVELELRPLRVVSREELGAHLSEPPPPPAGATP